MDYGHVFENIIAIELLRRGYEVYVGVLYKMEIYFVTIKRNEKIYIQVSDNISEDKTFKREITSLLKLMMYIQKWLLHEHIMRDINMKVLKLWIFHIG